MVELSLDWIMVIGGGYGLFKVLFIVVGFGLFIEFGDEVMIVEVIVDCFGLLK